MDKVKVMQKEIAPQVKIVLSAEQYAKWEKGVKRWLEQLQKRAHEGRQNPTGTSGSR